MQEYKGDELLKTIPGEIRELMAEPMDEDATHRTIGKLPVKGALIKINGLEFIVKFVDYKRGSLQLTIRKPKHDQS
jgi:hypothetical protein